MQMKYKGRDYKFFVLPKKQVTIESLQKRKESEEAKQAVLFAKLDEYITKECGIYGVR
jgi:hypothetical protein